MKGAQPPRIRPKWRAPEWMRDAACAGQDPAMWDETGGVERVTAGAEICNTTCPVRAQCLTYAAEFKRTDGIVMGSALWMNGHPRSVTSKRALGRYKRAVA